jgi:hypothetical protein
MLPFAHGLLLLLNIAFIWGVPALPCLAYGNETPPTQKVPPPQEALVPFAFHVGIQSKLNPPFPLEGHPPEFKGVQVISTKMPPISPRQYQQYWAHWKPLWPSLESFHTLFTQADEGKDTISVQYLSARITSLSLLYHKHFEATPEGFKAFESFRALESLMAHLDELAYILKQQGRMDLEYRPYANDVEEEQLAYQRHFRQVRQDLEHISRLHDMQEVLSTGFRKTDK